MKLTPLLTLLVLLGLGSARAADIPIVSPEVQAGRATLRLKAPAAAEVSVRGSFAEEKVVLTKSEGGVWEVTLDPLEPEIYTYAFEVGGAQFPDPRNRDLKIGGTLQSLLIVPDAQQPRAWEDRAGIARGALHHHIFTSKLIANSPRGCVVWTPPSYDTRRAEPYPVLFLLHGSGDDEHAWPGIGRARQIADALLAERKMGPMVIVMPFGLVPQLPETPAETWERRSFNIHLFTRSLVEELMPAIEREYHVARSRERRAVAGLSFGGGQAAYAGLRHPELFAWVGSFSASPPPADWTEVAEKDADFAKRFRLFWLACGDRDKSTIDRNEAEFFPLLKKHGLPAGFTIIPGGHEWKVWRANLIEFLPKLFRP